MSIEVERREGSILVRPQGRLDVNTAPEFLETVDREMERPGIERIRVDVGQVKFIDSAGAAVLIEGRLRAQRLGLDYTLRNLNDDVRRIFALTEGADLLNPPPPARTSGPGFVEWLGAEALGAGTGVLRFHRLLFDTVSAIVTAPFAARRVIRRNLVVLYMERTGWDAVPIVSVIMALVGIVVALQAATQLEIYGGVIFVADLVGISLTRELGPLITAIVMAGRSGSAFAAEIGTMKVNEEIDALRSMGLSPVHFLVIPKFLAMVIMMPCLVALADTVGILGGMLVGVTCLDLAPGVYWDETVKSLKVDDLVTGMIKTVVFAALIAATGCFRGFEVEGGADGVGRKTTSSVVTAIFLVILADAAFTALFYAIR